MVDKKYGIGIDTGGTFTDGVLIDLADNSVVATAKKNGMQLEFNQETSSWVGLVLVD